MFGSLFEAFFPFHFGVCIVCVSVCVPNFSTACVWCRQTININNSSPKQYVEKDCGVNKKMRTRLVVANSNRLHIFTFFAYKTLLPLMHTLHSYFYYYYDFNDYYTNITILFVSNQPARQQKKNINANEMAPHKHTTGFCQFPQYFCNSTQTHLFFFYGWEIGLKPFQPIEFYFIP